MTCGAVIVMSLSRVLSEVHSKDHSMAASTSGRHAGRQSRQPRYTTIGDATAARRGDATPKCY